MSNSSKSKNDASVKASKGSAPPASASAKRAPVSSTPVINPSPSKTSTTAPSSSSSKVVSPRKDQTSTPYPPEQPPKPTDPLPSVSRDLGQPTRTVSAPLPTTPNTEQPLGSHHVPFKSGATMTTPQPPQWNLGAHPYNPVEHQYSYNPYNTPAYTQPSVQKPPSKAIPIKDPNTQQFVSLKDPSPASNTGGFKSGYTEAFVPRNASTAAQASASSASSPSDSTTSSSTSDKSPSPTVSASPSTPAVSSSPSSSSSSEIQPKPATPTSMFPEFAVKKDDKSAAVDKDDDKEDSDSKKKKKNIKEVAKNADKGNYAAKEFDAFSTKPKEKEIKPEPAPSTSSSSSSASEPAKDEEEDSWDKKPDLDESITAVLKNSQNVPRQPYRPPGATTSVAPQQPTPTPHNSSNDKDPNWNAGGEGKKTYNRDYLLQFQDKCRERPANLPSIDVILGNEDSASLRSSSGSVGSYGGGGGRNKPSGDRGSYPRGPRNDTSFPGGAGAGGPGGRGGKSAKGPGGRGGSNSGAKHSQNQNAPAVAPLKHNPDAYQRPDLSTLDDDTLTLRKANGHLNKLAMDNFLSLSDKIIDIPITSVFILDGIIAKIFEKALSEPKFVGMYANLCAKISAVGKIAPFPDPQDPTKTITFRRALLNKCQEEFESNQSKAKTARAATVAKEGQVSFTEEQKAEQELENTKARKRYLGNIKFIGELYKCDMLTEKIMHECIVKLLGEIKHPSDEDLEALCKLLSTIGKKLDQNSRAKSHMDTYFSRINTVTNHPSISPRIKFALEEVMELRKNSWVPRRDANAPKTIKELHKEAAAAEVANQRAAIQQRQRERDNPPPKQSLPPSRPSTTNTRPGAGRDDDGDSRGGRGGSDRGGRSGPASSRGAASSQDDGWNTVPTSNRSRAPPPQSEAQRAKPSATAGNILLAPPARNWEKGAQGSTGGADSKRQSSGMYDSITPSQNSQRGGKGGRGADGRGRNDRRDSDSKDKESAPAPATTAAPKSMEEIEKELKTTLDEFATSGDAKEAAMCVKDLNSPSLFPDMVNHLVMAVLEKKDKDRERVTALLRACLEENVIPAAKMTEGFAMITSQMSDLVIDIPMADKYVGSMMGELIVTTSVGFALTETLKELVGVGSGPGIAGKMISEVFRILSEKKPDLAEKNKESIPKFYKAGYTGEMATAGSAAQPKAPVQTSAGTSKIVELINAGETPSKIIAWIKEHISQVTEDEATARGVMKAVLVAGQKNVENGTAEERTNAARDSLEKYAVVLQKVIIGPLQQAALFEVQGFWDSLKRPKGMMDGLFDTLYGECAFDEDAFIVWSEDSSDNTPGKTEALVDSNKWLSDLKQRSEEEDDEEA
eukprot:TRINITY_DN3973_c0_g1_i1.p1 TRINITY_DN3973_c0_g1~~TRINITY_DN3973_c0_g1_i1.p1  ORF type:complete len:1353 (-),score=469.42 TRINITY_DN3973_c0_g1_i1:142-4200(-)